MATIPANPTLADLQRFVAEMVIERGFSNKTLIQEALMMGEEVGELFKAIRKAENMGIDTNSKVGTAAEELADIFFYLCNIANKMDVDLEEAIRMKEEKNKTRKWA